MKLEIIKGRGRREGWKERQRGTGLERKIKRNEEK